MKRTLENGELLTKQAAFVGLAICAGRVKFSRDDAPERLALLQVRHCKRTGLVNPATVSELARRTLNHLCYNLGRRDLVFGPHDPVKLLLAPSGAVEGADSRLILPPGAKRS